MAGQADEPGVAASSFFMRLGSAGFCEPAGEICQRTECDVHYILPANNHLHFEVSFRWPAEQSRTAASRETDALKSFCLSVSVPDHPTPAVGSSDWVIWVATRSR